MRVLVTGTSGQLARCLQKRAEHCLGIEMVFLGRPQVDLADPERFRAAVERSDADIVVSAAAYTAVDRAESDRAMAHAVNVAGAEAVARGAMRIGAPVIHISTDYVFGGSVGSSLKESQDPHPCCEYGRTKLAGEQAVMASNANHFILRTSWLYSPFGDNFVKSMLRLAETRDTIQVVSDQRGNPTSGLDFAAAVLHVCRYANMASSGIYHVAGTGAASRADLARAIMEASADAGGPFADIVDVPSSAYPTPATRPLDSSLSCERFSAAFGWRLPPWQDSVRRTVRRLMEEQQARTLPFATVPREVWIPSEAQGSLR